MQTLAPSTIESLYRHALKGPGKKQWWITRLAMYRALEGKLSHIDSETTNVLAISNSEWFARDTLGLLKSKVTKADYPTHNLVDLNKISDSEYDICVSDQVLEHIEGDPFKAFSESARVVRSGGYVCHTTCLINEIHGSPSDFWRFTPDALRLLARASGLTVEMVGGWGNREAVGIMNSALRYEKIPEDPANPVYQLAMRSDPDWPISVWILARKP